MLFTLMFKCYTQGCAVTVEFHLIASLVDQPLRASLWEGTLEQLTEELSADSLPKSSRAFVTPMPLAYLVPSGPPLMAVHALPVHQSSGVSVALRETSTSPFSDDVLYIIH